MSLHRNTSHITVTKPPLPSSTVYSSIAMDRKLSDSTGEPSLTNTTSSENDSSSLKMNDSSHNASNRPLHIAFPLHSKSSLLDLDRDDGDESQEDDDHDLYLTAKSIQAFDNSDDDDSNVNFHTLSSPTSLKKTSSILHLSESISTSFCSGGSEVMNVSGTNPCVTDDAFLFQTCGKDLSQSSQPTVPFSDRFLQNRIMQDLTYILGSSAIPCCVEKSLFSDCFGGSLEYKDCEPNTSTAASAFITDKVRNRAGESWRARAYRIRRLREEKMLHDGFQPHNFVTSQSFDGIGGIGGLIRNRSKYDREIPLQYPRCNTSKESTVKSKPKQEVRHEPLGCMIGDCIAPISSVEGDDFEIQLVKTGDILLDDEDLCYDSDPCIAITNERRRSDSMISNFSLTEPCDSPRPRRCVSDGLSSTKSPRKKWFLKSPIRRRRKIQSDVMGSTSPSRSDIETSLSFDDSIDDVGLNTPCRQISLLDPEDDIVNTVQTTMNQLWTLTWHPAQRVSNSTKTILSRSISQSSRTVQVWFERGNRVHQSEIVEPKLMWRDAYHPELSSYRRLNESTVNGPHQVCLLSISRVLALNNIDRTKYPFAKKVCSFMIKTSDDEEYLFEAPNQTKRDQIVHSWKLVVARLASQAVVGDGEGMVGEFFVSTSFRVHGA